MLESDLTGATMPARLGGRLCLDFVNTVEFRASESPMDYLGSYADLVTWSAHAHVTDRDAAELLVREATRHPAVATATFAWAVTVREAMYGVFAAVANGRQPNETRSGSSEYRALSHPIPLQDRCNDYRIRLDRRAPRRDVGRGPMAGLSLRA